MNDTKFIYLLGMLTLIGIAATDSVATSAIMLVAGVAFQTLTFLGDTE